MTDLHIILALRRMMPTDVSRVYNIPLDRVIRVFNANRPADA